MKIQSLTQYHQWTDERLMEAIANKEHRAFEVLYARYSKPVFGYFYRMLWKNRELANDFTQDLFTKVVLYAHQFDTKRPFKTWMYSMANNLCKNEYAKAEVRSKAVMEVQTNESSTSIQNMDLAHFKSKLKQLIQELDPIKRETIELRFFQELSVPEIAHAMSVSEGTVKSRIFYILKDFQRELAVFKEILGVVLITFLI
jgi:RNA polymerase sigma-70 factor (ECF subfamily)